ncbi:unnamed protein product [Sympodiomycopsis kandeliae]
MAARTRTRAPDVHRDGSVTTSSTGGKTTAAQRMNSKRRVPAPAPENPSSESGSSQFEVARREATASRHRSTINSMATSSKPSASSSKASASSSSRATAPTSKASSSSLRPVTTLANKNRIHPPPAQPNFTSEELISQIKDIQTLSQRAPSQLLRLLRTSPDQLDLSETFGTISNYDETNQQDALQLAKRVAYAALGSYKSLQAANWKTADPETRSPTANQVELLARTSRVAIRAMIKYGSQETDTVADCIYVCKGRLITDVHDGVLSDLSYLKSHLMQQPSSSAKDPSSPLQLATDLMVFNKNDISPLLSTQTILDIYSTVLTALMSTDSRTSSECICDQVAQFNAAIQHPTQGLLSSLESAKSEQSTPSLTRAIAKIPLLLDRVLNRLSLELKTPCSQCQSQDNRLLILLKTRFLSISILISQPSKEDRRDAILDRILRTIVVRWKESKNYTHIKTCLDEVEKQLSDEWLEHDIWRNQIMTRMRNWAVSAGCYDHSEKEVEQVTQEVAAVNLGSDSVDKVTEDVAAINLQSHDVETVTEDVAAIELHSDAQDRQPKSKVSCRDLLKSCEEMEDILLSRYNKIKGSTSKDGQSCQISSTEQGLMKAVISAVSSQGFTDDDYSQRLLTCADNLSRLCAYFQPAWLQDVSLQRRRLRIDFHKAVIECIGHTAGVDNNKPIADHLSNVLMKSAWFAQTLRQSKSYSSEREHLEILTRCQVILSTYKTSLDTSTLFTLYAQLSEFIWCEGVPLYHSSNWAVVIDYFTTSAQCHAQIPLDQQQQHLQKGSKKLWEKYIIIGSCHSRLQDRRSCLSSYASAIQSFSPKEWDQILSLTKNATLEETSSEECIPLTKLKNILHFILELSIVELLIDQHQYQSDNLSILSILTSSTIPQEAQATCLEYISTCPAMKNISMTRRTAAMDSITTLFLSRSIELSDDKVRRKLIKVEREILNGNTPTEECSEIIKVCQDEQICVRGRILGVLAVCQDYDLENQGKVRAVNEAVRVVAKVVREFTESIVGDERVDLEGKVGESKAPASGLKATTLGTAAKPGSKKTTAAAKSQTTKTPVAASSRTKTTTATTRTKPTTSSQARPLAKKALNVTPPPPDRRRKANVVSETVTAQDTARELSGANVALLELACDHLLGAGHIAAGIDLLRALHLASPLESDTHVRAACHLADEYLTLGRVGDAQDTLRPLDASSLASPSDECFNFRHKLWTTESRFLVLVTQVRILCALGSSSKATKLYAEAIRIAELLHTDLATQFKQSASSTRTVSFTLLKVAHYHRARQAHLAYACLSFANGDVVQGMKAAHLSLREASSSLDLMSQLCKGPEPEPTKMDQTENVFDQKEAPISSADQNARDAQIQAQGNSSIPPQDNSNKISRKMSPPARLHSLHAASLHWRGIKLYLDSYLHLISMMETQGSASDALGQLDNLLEFSENLQLPQHTIRILLSRASLLFKMHKEQPAKEDVERAKGLLAGLDVSDAPQIVELACIRARYLASRPDAELQERALQIYQGALDDLEKSPVATDRVRIDLVTEKAVLLARLGRPESLDSLQDVSSTPSTLASAEISLRQALKGMSNDPLWGMLSEAVLSLPMGASATHLAKILPACNADAMDALMVAEKGYNEVISQSSNSILIPAISLRKAFVGLAYTIIVQHMITPKLRGGASSARLLESCLTSLSAGVTITLQRELSQAIANKLEPDAISHACHWTSSRFFLLAPATGAQKVGQAKHKVKELQSGPAGKRAVRARSESPISVSDPDSDSDASEDEDESDAVGEEKVYETFWKNKQTGSPHKPDPPLPSGWTVLTVSLSPSRNSLLVSRQGCDSRIFSLPFDRHSRDEDSEDVWTLDVARSELSEIVDESNHLSGSASSLGQNPAPEVVKGWWDSRRELDERLKTLCHDIEEKWLGPFKGLFALGAQSTEEIMGSPAMRVFKKTLMNILQKACFSVGTPRRAGSGSRSASASGTSSRSTSPLKSSSSTTAKLKFDDGVFEMMAHLSGMTTSDEELEDLLTHLMELYQFNGLPIALDEVDLDVMVVDLRSALDELRSGLNKQGSSSPEAGGHLFLILDKDTCSFPWESIPCLRGKAVCRIPSLSFLYDRVQLAQELGARQDSDGSFHLPRQPRTYYLVNPSGDLSKTQDRFSSYLTQERTPSWSGIMGRAPIATEFLDALSSQDLVLYFGHGGGGLYARPSKIRSLKKCAVTMLWGCSSSLLQSQGDFDPTGTPCTYMLSGSMCLVGQLFDCTDKELDCIAESVLIQSSLKPHEEISDGLKQARLVSKNRHKNLLVDAEGKLPKLSRTLALDEAVATSRDSCRLPYLTGASTVVWGVPVYFDR